MAEYGLHLSNLPLFLGQERLMILDRKVARNSITQQSYWRNILKGNQHKELHLGGIADTFVVFAHYKTKPEIHTLNTRVDGQWTWHSVSGLTDNLLVLRDNAWYLVVYNPSNIAAHLLDTDFYIYRLARHNEITHDVYGLNVYDAAGTIQYHSGWHTLRLTHSIADLYVIAENGDFKTHTVMENGTAMDRSDNKILFSMRDHEFVHSRDIQALVDWQFRYGMKRFVGSNKMVNIGYHVSGSGSDYQNNTLVHSTAFYSPIIADGHLSLSLSYIYLGGNQPLIHTRNNRLAYGRSAEAPYDDLARQRYQEFLGIPYHLEHRPILVADIPQL